MPGQTTLKRIRLTLARSKEFPEGSNRYGYELIAPVDYDGHLDVEYWKRRRADCTVRHFAEGQDDEFGMLVHKGGGGAGGRWVLDYDIARTSDDEAGYLFGSHVFVPGDYVSIRNADGQVQTFKIASVEELAGAA
jgi:hypothetical protein